MSRQQKGDSGSITAFVVCLASMFVACAGLAVDSGRLVGAHVRAADVAENAARLGSQEIIGIREGRWRLDVSRARTAAVAFVTSEGLTGTVSVSSRSVTVSTSLTVRPTLLRMFGVGIRTVRATRTAEPRSPEVGG